MYCPKCGIKVAEKEALCPECYVSIRKPSVRKYCTICGKELKKGATVCSCGAIASESIDSPKTIIKPLKESRPVEITKKETGVCPKCGKEMQKGWVSCPFCGWKLDTTEGKPISDEKQNNDGNKTDETNISSTSGITIQEQESYERAIELYKNREKYSIDEQRITTVGLLNTISSSWKKVKFKQKYPSIEDYQKDKIRKPGLSMDWSFEQADYNKKVAEIKQGWKTLWSVLVSLFVIALFIGMVSGLLFEHPVGWLFMFAFVLGICCFLYGIITSAQKKKAKAKLDVAIKKDEEINRKRIEEYEKRLLGEKIKVRKEYESLTADYELALKVIDTAKDNMILAEDYFDDADILAGYLKSGRADNLKEALNLLDNKNYQEHMREMQAAHNEKMEREAKAQSRALEQQAQAAQLAATAAQEQARAQESALRAQKEAARDQARVAQRQAYDNRGSSAQCANCLNRNGCTYRANPPKNCGAFRSRY